MKSDIVRLVEATLILLREESACQATESDGEIDDDDTEHDEVLMDAVSDLLPAFAKSMGSQFAPIFENMFGPLMKFAVGQNLLLILDVQILCHQFIVLNSLNL